MKYDKNHALIESSIPGLPPPRRGKVRDIYDTGEHLLLVASDRISAFDVVMPSGIPDKGKVLTALSMFWFDFMKWLPNHTVTADVNQFPAPAKACAKDLAGRSILVLKVKTIPVECVARGYLVGSGWKEYQTSGRVCGLPLRPNYVQADKLDQAIFTPAYKAEQGEHDENISFARVVELVGADVAAKLRELTLKVYTTAADYAATRGVIIADTKFEFGFDSKGQVILIDEVLTPDSSRFWPAEQYRTGGNPPSLDKQFVRDYLESINFNKQPPAPELPADVVARTREKYVQALEQLTGKGLA
ncbi:MAG: phosphoribosylaminoimidazolesuccinocarboxamide synthase [Lentisphaerae bacterium RIFOXYB12_FULL_65_16]|nr:MAG: phosphoribosylaminoimidazolesuccinocarboxamide synthase [Lentisphaerae bacterium RIFOXYA12_64_32]OGV87987.1 MAG: phosphoribosylaminoimidazolesuccinocarboxamide synthase [Lentisphaerae bacterium RIFOXYB12_FULL_65_16]